MAKLLIVPLKSGCRSVIILYYTHELLTTMEHIKAKILPALSAIAIQNDIQQRIKETCGGEFYELTLTKCDRLINRI